MYTSNEISYTKIIDEHMHTAMAIDNNRGFCIMFENLLTQL